MPSRPGAGRRELPSSQLSTAEYATLVALLAAAIIGTALFVSWAYQQRGLLAPARTEPSFDPDYQPPPASPHDLTG